MGDKDEEVREDILRRVLDEFVITDSDQFQPNLRNFPLQIALWRHWQVYFWTICDRL
jgi:hypothetical protein